MSTDNSVTGSPSLTPTPVAEADEPAPPAPGGSSPGRGRRVLTTRVAGLPLVYFGVLLAVVLVAAYTGNLPDSMLGGFAITMALGGLLVWIGSLSRWLRDYGLPTVLCTFLPAVLVFVGIVPTGTIDTITRFMDYGFLDFFVIAVIAGSVLGMPRALLMKAGPRFVVPLLGCLVVTFLLIGALGAVTGIGFGAGVLMFAAPIMAGGLPLGAFPMGEMYAAASGTEAGPLIGQLVSVVLIANVFCILVAGVYNGLGRRRTQLFVGFDGRGELMRVEGARVGLTMPRARMEVTLTSLGSGLMLTAGLYVLGQLLGEVLPFLHAYAWTILVAALVKIAKLIPQEIEDASSDWGNLVSTTLIPGLLVAVSITYIDIAGILQSLRDPRFLAIIVATVVVATLSSGLLGWLVKFHFVEAAITPGLVMADSGGSGDVSVLSAAGRLHLMPFAALTNRIGGALVLFATSLLVPVLGAGILV